MRKEKNEEQSAYDIGTKKKWLSIAGFLISIVLLSIAITLSMNEEKATREAKINLEKLNSQNKITSNVIVLEQASSDLNKDINQVKENNRNENNINENINDTTTTVSNEVETNNTSIDTNAGNENRTNEIKNETNQNEKNKDKEETKQVEQFIKPVEGEHLTNYSMDSLVYSNTLQEWITHRGIDIKAEKTTVVKASAEGKVASIKNDPRYGLTVIIEHVNGYKTVYANLLSTEFVVEGETVKQGQSIGTVGNTASFEISDEPHLHFELLKENEQQDPELFLKK